MNRKLRSLLLLLAALVLLGGVIGGVLLFSQEPVEENSYTPIQHAREDVAEISVTNEVGSFTIVRDTARAAGYRCDEIEGLPQLLSLYTTLVDDCREVSASFRYEGEDPARYGLDNPRAEVTVSLQSGEQYTIIIGNRAPSENYCYFSVSTEPDVVYATRQSQFSSCFGNAYAFVNRLLAPHSGSPRSGNDETDLPDWFEFTNRDGVRFHVDRLQQGHTDGAGIYNTFRQTLPAEGYVTGDAMQLYFPRLMQFRAARAHIYHPTEEQIAACGLQNPLTELVVGFGEETAVIRLARMENGTDYYAYKEGVDVIWVVADYLVGWLDYAPRTLLGAYPVSPALSETAVLTVTAGQERWEFEIAEDSAALSGAAVDWQQFQKLYTLACSVNSQSPAEQQSGETVLEISFRSREGKTETLSLYRDSARSLGIRLDGEALGLSIRESYAETLVAACRAVAAGESVNTSW